MHSIFISDRVRNIPQDSSSLRPVESLSGIGGASALPGGNASGAFSFGPAYVRHQENSDRAGGGLAPTYTARGALQGADPADERTVSKLEQRDREVRNAEKAKGEAVGGENFIYQVGPDGKRYAIGTALHTVASDGGPGGTADPAEPEARLSPSDRQLVDDLKARDAKVRRHEAEHVMAAGGQAQGMPTYTYQTGPDGRRYAVGGSVNISMLTTGDAEQNMRQAQKAYRAAMATGEPSSADMQVAMKARSNAAEARAEDREKALAAYAYQAAAV